MILLCSTIPWYQLKFVGRCVQEEGRGGQVERKERSRARTREKERSGSVVKLTTRGAFMTGCKDSVEKQGEVGIYLNNIHKLITYYTQQQNKTTEY